MKSIYKYLFILLGFTAAVTSCNFKEQIDPDKPSIGELTSKSQINSLLIGSVADLRTGLQVYRTASGTIARELYLFDADPRNTEDLLGKNGGGLDNNSFYLNGWYTPYYRVVKNCNLLIEAVSKDVPGISTTEVKGYTGFAKTLKAYVFIQVLNLLDDNGVRIEVADPNNLGGFVTGAAAYTAIRTLLDEASTDLDAAGTAFGFDLTSGFAGFNAPATFKQFNRALAAKVALYQQNWADVLTLLGTSFYNASGDLNAGPQHVFSNAAGDILNPLFYGVGSDNIYAHPTFNANAEAGDKRVSDKTLAQPNTKDNLSATHRQNIYKSGTDAVSILRNEELVLMAAEANVELGNFATATTLINTVRTAAGLANYTNPNDKTAMITQVMKERLYSLWLEGVRMVDLRRRGLLNATNLPIDRSKDIVHTKFPIPLSDSN